MSEQTAVSADYDTALDEWRAAHPEAQQMSRSAPRQRVNYTARAQQRLAEGRHPVMYPAPLREPEGETCGSCGHLVAREFSGRYLKCDLADTASEATDIRKWWPACVKWKPSSPPASLPEEI